MRTLTLLTLVLVAGCDGDTSSSFDGDLPDAGGLDDAGRAGDAGPAEACETPGAVEEVACGACGTRTRFCTNDLVWAYGLCEGESGVCNPGETRESACGNCGMARQVCNESCAWSEISACTGEGECAPGELVRSSEGCPAGQRDLRCSDSCTFEPVSDCMSDPCTTPGASESVACGRCGTRTRFCTSGMEWEYGTCGGELECTPGTTRSADCGNCGTQEERCSAECGWFAFGECTGEGECAPGAMRTGTEGCTGGQQRPFTCSDACIYQPSGACTAPTGQRGELCTGASCASGLVCDTTLGVGVCRPSCATAGSCPDGDYCFTTDMVCEDDCTVFTDAGCPTGTYCAPLGIDVSNPVTICAAIGTGGMGTTCVSHADCRRGHLCVTEADGITLHCHAVCDNSHACTTGSCTMFDIFGAVNGLGFCE